MRGRPSACDNGKKIGGPVSRTLAAVQIRLSRPRTRARPATEAATLRGRRSRHCARTPTPTIRLYGCLRRAPVPRRHAALAVAFATGASTTDDDDDDLPLLFAYYISDVVVSPSSFRSVAPSLSQPTHPPTPGQFSLSLLFFFTRENTSTLCYSKEPGIGERYSERLSFIRRKSRYFLLI